MGSVNAQKQCVKSATPEEARQQLAQLYQIFGRAVFLVLPFGQKALKVKGWQRITLEDTQKPAYQQKLIRALMAGGNLAVRLGPLSDGLRAIDLDRKDRVEEFCALNPQLRDTVKAYGRKGFQFFFRLTPGTPFPTGENGGYTTLDCDDGEKFGEWRFGESAGAYSVIYGQHPDDAKVLWRLEGEIIKVLNFTDIDWPPDVRLPWLEEPDARVDEDVPLKHIPPEKAKRIEAYLKHCPLSIAGKGGDTELFKTACKISNGFDLDEEQTYDALKRWFNPHCKPPWKEERLRYKAAEAQKVKHQKPRGHFLKAEEGYPPLGERPCFRVYHHFWNDGEHLRPPGTYCHTFAKGDNKGDMALVDDWFCTPLEILAITSSREDSEYGWLVEFTSRNERRKRCAIPARWFAARGDEVLSELLNLGLDIAHGRNPRSYLLQYISTARPEKRFAAALSTGWHDGRTFVLPGEVIGETAVWYQGKDEEIPYARAGKFERWQTQVAAYAKGNPNVIVALCGALAGPLFYPFNVPGGGLHWVGHTTQGKTTTLEVGQSVWGGPKFRRTWETTAVGLQAVAMLHTDTLLVLDEIHMVDPKVLDSAIYALINGYGKSRGNIHAASRPTARWRVLVLSSGEVSSETQLSGSGLIVRTGQTIRVLDIPIEGEFGAFDELHGFKGGAEFSDALRGSVAQHYGHAGPRFVRALIKARTAGELDLSARLIEVQKSFEPSNEPQRRAARTFAILALAGELGVEWEILPWERGEATSACVLLFKRWQAQTVISAASSPEKKILASVTNFISRFGDARFSDVQCDLLDTSHVRDRAGYWLDEPLPPTEGKVSSTLKDRKIRRIYLFTASGLREAAKNYDFRQVLSALDAAGAFVRKGKEEIAIPYRTLKGVEKLYCVDPAKLD